MFANLAIVVFGALRVNRIVGKKEKNVNMEETERTQLINLIQHNFMPI